MRKFHRMRGRRRLFLKSLVANFVMRKKIETTLARAREIRPAVERLMTVAKRQNIASLRLLRARLPKDAAEKLYYEIAPKYKDRKGGYLRIIKQTSQRMRDGSKMATIEFV